MDFSERMLVLQVGKFKEADLWVRLLSPTRGLLTAFAFGGSRSRRRFVGCLDIFNEISIRVRASRRTAHLALQEGVLIRGVERLRQDWQRFGLAVNCVRFLQSFGVGPDGAEKAHRLMCETLLLLEEAETLPRLLPFLFRARFVFDQGYALSADACGLCGCGLHGHSAHLLLREGRLVCPSCAVAAVGPGLAVSNEALTAVRMAQRLSPREWTSVLLPPFAAREFSRAVDGFIEYHVGLAWDRGRFVRV